MLLSGHSERRVIHSAIATRYVVEMTTSEVPPPNTARRWVGANLRHLRTSQGLTLEQLAERVTALGFGIDKASLSRIENGRTNVDVEKLLAFAQALDVAPDRLLRDPEHLDAALLDRIYRHWRNAAREWRRLEAISSLLFDEIIKVGARLPNSNASLDEFRADLLHLVSREGWVLAAERVEPGSQTYDAFIEQVATGHAFVWSDQKQPDTEGGR